MSNYDAHPDDMADVAKRRESHGRWFRQQQPKALRNVLSQVMQRRGYAQLRTAAACDEAWRAAVGERFAPLTEPGQVRRGTLEVIVGNSLLMQELGFEKERLLGELQKALPDAGIKNIRFKVGKVSKQ
ncbi:MAG: hypothetical protein CMJ58_20680 [Planctomycetaceae bacterium]|nr:hypothetical protein [Planctomycetaceae bacterium]